MIGGFKKLFEDNGFSFAPNRFPEVYYDDYDKVKELYPEIKSDQDGTPDYLGVYIYQFKSGPKERSMHKEYGRFYCTFQRPDRKLSQNSY
jgi:hypothetical protein